MVGEQQVGVPRGRLARHRQRRVHGQQHPAYVRIGVAGRQADRVPLVGGLGRVPAVDQVDDVGQAEAWADR